MAQKAGRGSEEATAVIRGEGPEAPPGLGGAEANWKGM